MKKTIKQIIEKYLNEQVVNNLVLYRGVTNKSLKPTSNNYAFFAEDESFAAGYGSYVWKCTFKPLNLFISYSKKYIQELYDNGFKLRDTYIEDMWNKISLDIKNLYNYDDTKYSDDWGYKSAEHLELSPYFVSDTWEMIEKSNGVLDYILSNYDGVVLLEGGQKTYYLRTDKIIDCELL